MINPDRLTIKAAEAIQAAAQEAQRRGNPSIEDLHLLNALLAQDETVAVPILQKVGVNVARLRDLLNEALNRLPRQSGGSAPSMSRELSRILDDAGLAAELGAGAHERVYDRFLGDRHLEAYANLFRTLLS